MRTREYLHNHRRGYVEGDFESAVQKEFSAQDLSRWDRRRFSFLSRGNYATQVSSYLEQFPRENLFFVVIEEDFGPAMQGTLDRLCEFLGVPAMPLPDRTEFNAAYAPRSMGVQRFAGQ